MKLTLMVRVAERLEAAKGALKIIILASIGEACHANF